MKTNLEELVYGRWSKCWWFQRKIIQNIDYQSSVQNHSGRITKRRGSACCIIFLQNKKKCRSYWHVTVTSHELHVICIMCHVFFFLEQSTSNAFRPISDIGQYRNKSVISGTLFFHNLCHSIIIYCYVHSSG